MSPKKKIDHLVCREHGLAGLHIEPAPANTIHRFKVACTKCAGRFTGWCNEVQAQKLFTEYRQFKNRQAPGSEPPTVTLVDTDSPPLVPKPHRAPLVSPAKMLPLPVKSERKS